jgi:hypothetical protein
MSFLAKLFGRKASPDARKDLGDALVRHIKVGAIYERVMSKYTLPKPEEYFVVVGVTEFLSKEPRKAFDTLFRRINRFRDETGIHVGGLGAENFEHPFKELLDAYQKAMGNNEVDHESIMLFLGNREKTLEGQAGGRAGK